MTISLVKLITDQSINGKPLIGYGFTSNGRYAQGGILRERIIPRLQAAAPADLLNDDGINLDPFKCWDVMMTNEKPGGHGERSVAVGVLDMAIWDIVAKVEDVPLYLLLADRYRDGNFDPDVEVYAAGGYYYPGQDSGTLQNEIRRYLELGFTAVKMKIGGSSLDDDLARIEAALEIVGEGRFLAVDANARFDLETAVQYAEALAQYDLRWYEEPVDPLDYELLAQVADVAKMPIATGENIFSFVDSRNLVRFGGLNPNRDYLQMDPVLSYGLVEYLRILDMLSDNGWSARRCVPHGGHQFGLHLAAGLGLMGNESYPEVFKPFGKFADDMVLHSGKIKLTDAPGIGYEAIADINRLFDF